MQYCAALVALVLVQQTGASSFFFGTATAAYQIEGSRDLDGRTPSVWDAFDTKGISEEVPGVNANGDANVLNGQNAAIADMDYSNYNETIGLLQHYGFDAYRMSISWTRILSYELVNCSGPDRKTTCRLADPVLNQKGLQHYKQILQQLRAASITTAVTMWHWDTPLSIEEYALITECSETNQFTVEQTGSAWLCPIVSDLFADYAKVLLEELDDLVDHWITLNEPLTVTGQGYAAPAKHAPGRCLDRTISFHGNETIEPYYVVKNMMLAHAKAYRIYQQGVHTNAMGFAANADWRQPISDCIADQQAAVNSLVWQTGIFWDLLATGDWAPEIKAIVPEPRLPRISTDETAVLQGAHGHIYYQNMYTSGWSWAIGEAVTPDCPEANASWRAAPTQRDFNSDALSGGGSENPVTGESIGVLAPGSVWLHFTPVGLPKLQRWLNNRYAALNLSFVVTENGWGGAYATREDATDDEQRCEYYRQYLGNMSHFELSEAPLPTASPLVLSAEAPTVLGYFAWSLMDNFEWNDGFSQRFGITYVEYCGANNDEKCAQTRIPKMSATWFREMLKDRAFRDANIAQWKALPVCKWYDDDSGSGGLSAGGVAAILAGSALLLLGAGYACFSRKKRAAMDVNDYMEQTDDA